MENEEFAQCPNHWAHRVLRSRMQYHLLKCDRQYPHLAAVREKEGWIACLQRELENAREELRQLREAATGAGEPSLPIPGPPHHPPALLTTDAHGWPQPAQAPPPL